MATTRQNFFQSLFANGGHLPSLENFKDYNQFELTDKGNISAQCTEEDDVQAGACFPRTLPAAVSRISVNIPIRTSRNRPTEGDDNTLHGC